MATPHDVTASIELESFSSPASLTLDDDIQFPQVSQKQLAWQDILDGIKKWPIWLMLAYQDIKLRYRRSILGPFWITISMAVTVYSMGFLYGHLFHTELQHYYPFLVGGMLAWSLISGLIIDFTDGLVTSDNLIKQIKLPYSLYIHRITARNLIIFFHNIIVIVPIIAIFHEYAKINWYTLLLIPGLCILYFNAISYGLLLGLIGARFRDVSQIIKSLVQVIFFITPVMWAPEVLGRSYYAIDLNPFYAFIELIRAPLLGHAPTLQNFAVAGVVTIIGVLISAKIFIPYRSRIVYWL